MVVRALVKLARQVTATRYALKFVMISDVDRLTLMEQVNRECTDSLRSLIESQAPPRPRAARSASVRCKNAKHAATCWVMRRFESRVAAVAWLVGATTLGCDSFAEAPKQTYDNTGTVCLTLSSGMLKIAVQFPTCLSSSCDRALATSCEATLSDGVITLTSHGASESTGDTACTDDCGSLTAACVLPTPLAPGDYILNHGNDSAAVTVSTTQTCAFGR